MNTDTHELKRNDSALFDRIVAVLEQARSNVVRAVNSNTVVAYWLIGREIVKELQKGEQRAEYGKRVIEDLSNRLTERYGKGFSVPNLRNFRKFYVMFQDRKPEIRYPMGSELTSERKRYPTGNELSVPGKAQKEMEEQPMVDNPKIRELKKQKANRVSALHKLKVQLADEILKEKDKTKLEEIKKKQIALLADIARIDNEILFIDQEIDKTPKKIRFDQANDGERLLKLNYEKKQFLDCIKVFVYNMKKKMCELLSNYYDAKKELLPALSMIVDRGGHIKLERGQLRVQLRGFMNSEIDYAARHICEDLNRINPVTLDRHRLPIRYEVL